jgi:hypothetical protein
MLVFATKLIPCPATSVRVSAVALAAMVTLSGCTVMRLNASVVATGMENTLFEVFIIECARIISLNKESILLAIAG